ncbi:hypothetical protein OLN68_09760 [Citrobacter freundii]|nr:hypothetical protein [Citrobacter freundii]MCW1445939.1 hypothetical protein [Citrobacter freundii]
MSEDRYFLYSKNQAWSVILIFTISLFLFWNICILKYGNSFLGSDSFIIVERIANSDHLRWFDQNYLSQFGLQGILLSFLHSGPFNFNVTDVSLQSSLLISFLTSFTFSVPSYKLLKLSGIYPVILYWISLALSPWALTFSYSLYWVPFTIILPFAIAFVTGKMMFNGKKWLMLLLIFIAMVIKCLCGYEYITTVTLFACAGYIFSLIGTNHKARIFDLFLIFLACVVGFAIAVTIHALQLNNINNAYGFSTIMNRVALHTGTDGGADYAQGLIQHLSSRKGNESLIATLSSDLQNNKLLFAWESFKEYFYLPALTFFNKYIPFGWFIFMSIMASVICILYPIKKLKDKINSNLLHYSIGCAFIVAGVFSWQILAWHHMTIHFHLNGQLFAYGIVPLAMISIGVLINKICMRFHAGHGLLTKTPVFIIVITCIYLSMATPFTRSVSITDSFLSFRERGIEVIGHVDQAIISPGSNELNRGLGVETSRVYISGWAVAKSDVSPKLFVVIKGGLVGEISPDIERDDVKKSYDIKNNNNGFVYYYDVPGTITKEDIKVLAPDGKGGYSEVKIP